MSISGQMTDCPTTGIEGAAEILRCHPQTVRALARSGKLPGSRPGRAWVFVVSDLLDMVRKGNVKECPSTKEKTAQTGISASRRQAEEKYTSLLGLQKEPKRANLRND